MEAFFTNPWTIGIGGGLVSGLIVFFVTSKIFSKGENKEYLQKIRIANNELLYAIRPLVVEQRLPTFEMINALLLSTAKKYNVQLRDLYGRDEVANDLVKEIMDNPFLTSESKLVYCELTENIKKLEEPTIHGKRPAGEVVYSKSDQSISKNFFSLTLAIMTSLTVIVTVLFYSKDKLISDVKSEKSDTISIISLLTLIPVLVAVIFETFKFWGFFKKWNSFTKDRSTELQKNLKDEVEEND